MNEDQDFLLPDDYTEEPTEENTVDETVEETTETVETTENAPEAVPSAQETPFLIAKYNKAEIPLDADSARNLAQLGMFYQEKIQPEYDRLKGIGDQYGKIEKLASLYGMTPDELHESLYNQYITSAAEAEGITPEHKRKDQELIQREERANAILTEAEKKEASQAMYSRFMDAYPDVKAEQIKPETWKQVDQGIDLVTAYTMQINQELQQQMKQAQQITKNKQTSPAVSTTSNGSAEPTKSDDFLSGLFGD